CGAVVAALVCDVLMELCTNEERDAVLGDAKSVTQRYLVNLAMATVCDVCPLVDVNRIIVKLGLKAAKDTENLGLQALIRECGLAGSEITTYHLGFVLGPCFNATGRLDVADRAFELLGANDEDEAASLARACKDLNEERKSMTAVWLDKAVEICERDGLANDHVLVVFLDGCHESLAGIIAGRLRERYSRPSIVLTRADDGVKGSGRSIEAYNMFEEISKASSLLTKFGGHPMAAGLSLPEENIEPFRKLLNEEEKLSDADLTEKLLIDAIVPFGLMDERVIGELSRLEPFGTGMSRPVFAEKDLKVLKIEEIGRVKKFLKFRLLNAGNRVIDAVYFGDSAELLSRLESRFGSESVKTAFRGKESDVTMTVAYQPEINEYQGIRSIRMKISDVL
ncbi:MAG: single-stranded-DNA-specific exonuclease RecJ, partial [Lachnospiraceae bacterium]|nr:single-stranded-DNA-specific exonuclease RecJ [Lachnospiraceae bacterium]